MACSHNCTEEQTAVHPVSQGVAVPGTPTACDACGSTEHVYRENLHFDSIDGDGDEVTRWTTGVLFSCSRSFAPEHGWINFCNADKPEEVKLREPEECDVCGNTNYLFIADENAIPVRRFKCGRSFFGVTPTTYCAEVIPPSPPVRVPVLSPVYEEPKKKQGSVWAMAFFISFVLFPVLLFLGNNFWGLYNGTPAPGSNFWGLYNGTR